MFKSNKNKILLIINEIRYTRLVHQCKVDCVFPMVDISLLLHTELGPIDHREDASLFKNDWLSGLVGMARGDSMILTFDVEAQKSQNHWISPRYGSRGTFGFRFQNCRRLLGNKNRIMIFSFLILKIITYNILFEINIFGKRGERSHPLVIYFEL